MLYILWISGCMTHDVWSFAIIQSADTKSLGMVAVLANKGAWLHLNCVFYWNVVINDARNYVVEHAPFMAFE